MALCKTVTLGYCPNPTNQEPADPLIFIKAKQPTSAICCAIFCLETWNPRVGKKTKGPKMMDENKRNSGKKITKRTLRSISKLEEEVLLNFDSFQFFSIPPIHSASSPPRYFCSTPPGGAFPMAFQKWLSQGVTKILALCPSDGVCICTENSTLDIQWLNFHHGKLAAGTQK